LRRTGAVTMVVCALVLPFRLAHSEGLPDLGDVSQGTITPQMERTIGQRIFNEIRLREPAYLDDPEVNAYLNGLGSRLSGHVEGGISDVTGSKGFEMFALRDQTLNAFAMPGGYIGVHTGLILSAQSESELAAVLAHEVSHVTQHHIARGVTAGSAAQLATMVSMAVALLAARSNPDLAMGAAMAGQAAGIQSQLNYSRDFEREADRLGLQLLGRAGFDIRGMPAFFERMQKYGALYEGKNSAPAYLRSHPLTTERISAVADRIEGQAYKQVPDSLEFQLVRARLRALTTSVPEALSAFKTQLVSAGLTQQVVAHYGIARIHLRDGNLDAASREFALLEDGAKAAKLASPMFESFAAELMLRKRDPVAAARLLERSRTNYPQDRAIHYLLVEAYLDAGKPELALAVTRDGQARFIEDPKNFALQARCFGALDRRMAHHRAQAEAYWITGQVPLAMEQIELAKKAQDGDFYEQSETESRYREIKERHLELLKEKRR
jgi:predicted Zn-dependent protease